MDNRLSGSGIDPKLRAAGQRLLESAHDIVARSGENSGSMHEVGRLLQNLAGSGLLDRLMDTRPGGDTASIDLLGESPDGANLSLYAMNGWVTEPKNDVHWHNYWQSLLVVRGTWRDTVWKPVRKVSETTAEGVEVDRRVVVPAGEIQVLGDDEPHGWEAGERRRADGVCLLMWSGSARGKARMDLDIVTGKLRAYHGFLNPKPGSTPSETLAQLVHGG